MKEEVLKSNAEVLLAEAMSVLAGLQARGLLSAIGAETDPIAAMLRLRAASLLSSGTAAQVLGTGSGAELAEVSYADQEVIGVDNDGQVICWDARASHEYSCGDNLQRYGIVNLKLHEIARVNVSVEEWLAATVLLQGDRDRQSNWSRTVYVKAHSTSEYGGEGPSYAKIVVDEAFVLRLLRLSNLCKKDGLSEARTCDGPALWGGCDEDAMRLTCAELVVSGTQFWFTDSPKHANYVIETDGHQISKLIQEALSGEGDVFLAGHDVEQLRQLVEEDSDVDFDEQAPQAAGEASSGDTLDGVSAS